MPTTWFHRLRQYYAEYTGSRPITEVLSSVGPSQYLMGDRLGTAGV